MDGNQNGQCSLMIQERVASSSNVAARRTAPLAVNGDIVVLRCHDMHHILHMCLYECLRMHRVATVT